MKLVTIDMILGDSPREWETWALSRKMKAVAQEAPPVGIENADRVEVLVCRDGYDETPLQLNGFVVSVIQPDNGIHLVVIECSRLGNGHDVSGLMAIVPSVGINRIISTLTQG